MDPEIVKELKSTVKTNSGELRVRLVEILVFGTFFHLAGMGIWIAFAFGIPVPAGLGRNRATGLCIVCFFATEVLTQLGQVMKPYAQTAHLDLFLQTTNLFQSLGFFRSSLFLFLPMFFSLAILRITLGIFRDSKEQESRGLLRGLFEKN